MTTADGSAPGATPDSGATAARARLARALHDSGHTPTPAVQAAFAAVPRHLFLPELDPAAVYQDEALVIKYSADGLPVASSSQPAMMAIMLEQLGLRRGHRVLEIGTGTGYNAAVMAHIVGPAGAVVTVDIDGDLITRAQSSLAAAGYDSVRAVQGDGGYGDPQDAPFDRVIVTAGAWDIPPAWLDQLGPGGRLVLPVSVRGIQLSIALERLEQARRLMFRDRHPPGAERWIAMSAFRCGFVRMAGAFADPEPFRQLGLAPGLYVQTDDGRQLDTRALASALSGPAVDVGSGVRARSRDEVADLDLWLTLTQPALSRVTIMETAASRAQLGPMLPFGGLARDEGDVLGTGGLGIAGLVGVRPLRAPPSTGPPHAAAPPAASPPPPEAAMPPAATPAATAARGPGPPWDPAPPPAAPPAGPGPASADVPAIPPTEPARPAPESAHPQATAPPGDVPPAAAQSAAAPEDVSSQPAEPQPAEPTAADPALAGPLAADPSAAGSPSAAPPPSEDPPPGPDEQRVYPGEIVVRGYGPAGAAVATHLAEQAAIWDARGRPGAAELCLTIWKADADVSPPAGQIVLARPHVNLAAGWPSR
jgi:protein-L-isoaspartate(D-aspartate) O-methyltransferase